MKPPKTNGRKISIHELSTRWISHECFISKFPVYLQKMANDGNRYALHEAVMDMAEAYIKAGEIEAVCEGFVDGLIPSYKEYSISGDSIAEFERDNFLSQPVPLQEQPARDSLDNPGGDHSMEKKVYVGESHYLKTIALLLMYIEDNMKRNQDTVSTALSEGKYKVRGLGKTNLGTVFGIANKELDK